MQRSVSSLIRNRDMVNINLILIVVFSTIIPLLEKPQRTLWKGKKDF